jgi:hypothetical protein
MKAEIRDKYKSNIWKIFVLYGLARFILLTIKY